MRLAALAAVLALAACSRGEQAQDTAGAPAEPAVEAPAAPAALSPSPAEAIPWPR